MKTNLFLVQFSLTKCHWKLCTNWQIMAKVPKVLKASKELLSSLDSCNLDTTHKDHNFILFSSLYWCRKFLCMCLYVFDCLDKRQLRRISTGKLEAIMTHVKAKCLWSLVWFTKIEVQACQCQSNLYKKRPHLPFSHSILAKIPCLCLLQTQLKSCPTLKFPQHTIEYFSVKCASYRVLSNWMHNVPQILKLKLTKE